MTTTVREQVIAKQGRSDAELQRLVLDELHWDSDVEEASIGVEVDKGVVTLAGTVGSGWERMAAQRAAHRVEGVQDVANDLEVNFLHPASDDTCLAQAIRRALESDARITANNIQSTVSNGLVTLEGTAPNWLTRQRAAHTVQKVVGVRSVTNCIEVTPAAVREEDLRHAIEQTLERQAAHRARRIHVGVTDGVVTLTGTIRSWPERQAMLESVGHAPGVRSVVDRLRVEPYL